ncbi:MAG: hypothetical protein R3F56_16700 [Planctomycetota bacterium]
MRALCRPTLGLFVVPILAASIPTQTSWQSIAAAGPTAVFQCASAADPVRDRVTLFGGRVTVLSVSNQTWEWDGTSWTLRTVTTSPPARANAAMAYDAARGKVVMFGGADGSFNVMGDMWSWDGTAWTRLAPATMPSAREGARMVYDLNRQVVVMFGGLDATLSQLADTWEWNGTDWTQRSPTTSPPGRNAYALSYDAARGETVLNGGDVGPPTGPVESDDTWVWDGVTWTQRNPANVPPGRWGHSMVFDPIRNRTLMVGGSALGSTRVDMWEWDGQRWISRGVNIRMSAHYSTMQMDPVRGLPVIYGSLLSSPRFWEYVTQAPVGFSTYGAACAGSNGMPHLDRDHSTSPLIGSTVRLRASALPAASGTALMILGSMRISIDLTPIGMVGCTQLATAVLHLPLVTAGGGANLDLGIPDDASLLGALVPAQCFAVDPGANALGVTASNGVELRVGI